MTLALRTDVDQVPELAPLDGLVIERIDDLELMARLQGRPLEALEARRDDGHHAWVASLGGTAAAFGWVATRQAFIGELGVRVSLPINERYLWNFVTLPAFRGRGIYPRLLDGIVRREAAGVRRWWVAFAPENHASGAGIRKAGFTLVADFSLLPTGDVAVRGLIPGGGPAAATLLALPEVDTPLDRCWHCGRARHLTAGCGKGPGCSCDYQRPEAGCHAA